MKRSVFAIFLLMLSSPPLARAAESLLHNGDYVAIVGDSITEQKQYSVFMEDYLLMCQPAADLRTDAVRLERRNVVGLRRADGQRHAALSSDGRHHLLRHERRRLLAR